MVDTLVPKIDVTIDQAKLRAIEQAVRGIPNAMPRIVTTSLKKTAKKGRTAIDKEIRARVMVKKKDVMKRIVDVEKANYHNWRWRLGISLKRLALSTFGNVKWKRTWPGVKYTIKKGQRKVAEHAFIAETVKGKPVFVRKYIGGRRVARKPLQFLRGPSLGEVVKDSPQILARVQTEGAKDLSKEMNSQLKRVLARRMPR